MAGTTCQEAYQPAANAQERFSTLREASFQEESIDDTFSVQDDQSPESSNQVLGSIATSDSSTPGSSTHASPDPDSSDHLSAEARAHIKEELIKEQRERTKELVDAAWQSLE